MNVLVTDLNENPVTVEDGFVSVNGIGYDLNSGQSYTEFYNDIPAPTETYIIQVYINDIQEFTPNCTNFIIPESIECCNTEDLSDCMIDTFSGQQQVFNVIPDYGPITIEYELFDPPCEGQEGEIIITGVSGGGCSDPSEYLFELNYQPLAFNELTLVSSELDELLIEASCTQGTFTNLDDCGGFEIDEFTFNIEYNQESEVIQVSCPNEDDGQII